MYKLLSIVVILYVILMPAALGQSKAAVLGKVVDAEDGLPLSNAKVLVYSGTDTLTVYANSNGLFSIPSQPHNSIIIEVSHFSYKTYRQAVDLFSNNEPLLIQLELNSEQLTEGLVVARSKALLRTAESGKININTDRLTQIPSALGAPDIIKVLQLMPGVQNSGEANGYLYVRGADPGHNLMLYDDAPVYGMSHLLGLFPFYNADHIDRVYFDKTNANARYGNRLSSTLQAGSPDEIPDHFSLKGNVGLVVSQLTAAIPVGDKVGVIVSGRQTYVDQILGPILNSAAKNEKNKIDDLTYSFTDANFTLLAKPNSKHSLSLNAFISGDRFGIKEKEMLVDGKMKWGNTLVSAMWQWSPNPDISFKQSLYFSHYYNSLDVSQASVALEVESKVVDWGANSLVEFKLLGVPVETGLQLSCYDVHPQEIVSTQLAWDNINATDNTVKAWQISAYIQAKPKLANSLYLDLGLRVNSYTATGKNKKSYLDVEPKASLSYEHSARFSSYVAYAQKRQYLNLLTTSSVGFPTDFWIAANDGIPAQSAHNFSIGSVYKPILGLEFTTGLFYSRLNNLVEYPFSLLQFNEISSFKEDIYVGKGKAYGAEFLVKKTGRLSGWISYTISKSDRKFSEVNDNRTYPAKFDRRHNLSVVAHYQLSKRWSTGLTQIYSTGSRYTTPTSWYFINNNPVKEYGAYNNAKMPDYIRTDIAIDFSLSKNAKRESVLNLSIYNLFAVSNPIYIILDISTNKNSNEVTVKPRYKRLYTILPSVSWRFKF